MLNYCIMFTVMELPVYKSSVMRVWTMTPIASTALAILEVAYGAITGLGHLFLAAIDYRQARSHLWDAKKQACWMAHGLLIAIPIIGNIGIHFADRYNSFYDLKNPF